jgi:peptidoglycan/xylan/chitin deacetylase (PgdA/CDA1 family)
MAMHSRTKSMLLALDQVLAACLLPVTNERGVLLSFLFHSLFEGPGELQSGIVDPQQGITVAMLRQVLGHFQKQSYEFVSPKDVLNGLPSDGKYVLLTFDDGYYNNIRALAVLEEFRAPATLFVSSNYMKQGKAFWWDVVYRESKKRGRGEREIQREVAHYKRLKTADVEAQLRNQFGADSLRPVSDLDRPFTPAELREFAEHPLISLGNHTSDHAILTNYRAAEVLAQIQGAQHDIQAMTGKSADMIAYPNGNESPEIVEAAKSVGIHFGIGVHPGRNRLPLRPGSRDAMTLKRFTLTGDYPVEAQCRTSRSGVSLYRSARSMKGKASAGFSSLPPA